MTSVVWLYIYVQSCDQDTSCCMFSWCVVVYVLFVCQAEKQKLDENVTRLKQQAGTTDDPDEQVSG